MLLPSRRDLVQVLPHFPSNSTLPYVTRIQPQPHKDSQALSQATIAVLCLGLIIAVALCLVLIRVLALQRQNTTGSLRDLPFSTRLSKALGIGRSKRSDKSGGSDSGSLISDVQERGEAREGITSSLPQRGQTGGHRNLFSTGLVGNFSALSTSRKKNAHKKNSSSFNLKTAIPSNWIYETSVVLPMSTLESEITGQRSIQTHQPPSSSRHGSGSTGLNLLLHSPSNSISTSCGSNQNVSISSPSNNSAFSCSSISESYSMNGFRTTPPQSPMRAIHPSATRRGSSFSSEAAQVVRRGSLNLGQIWREGDDKLNSKYNPIESSIFNVDQARPQRQFCFPSAQMPHIEPSASPRSTGVIESDTRYIPNLNVSESFQRPVESDAWEDPCQPLPGSIFNGYTMGGFNFNSTGETASRGPFNWTGATATALHSPSRRPSWLDGHSHSTYNSSSVHQSLRRPSQGPFPTPEQMHVRAPGHDLHQHWHLRGLSQPLPSSIHPSPAKKFAHSAKRRSASSHMVPAPNCATQSEEATSNPALVSAETEGFEKASSSIETKEEGAEHFEGSNAASRIFHGRVPMLRSASDAPSSMSLPRSVSRAGSLDLESESYEDSQGGSDWEEELADGVEGAEERGRLSIAKLSTTEAEESNRATVSNASNTQSRLTTSFESNGSITANTLNSSPTSSARLRGLAKPAALLEASLASHQNLQKRIGLPIKDNENSHLGVEHWEEDLTPRYSRFSISSHGSGSGDGPLASPTTSLAPTLIESSVSDPNTPTSPSAPITPNTKITPLPAIDKVIHDGSKKSENDDSRNKSSMNTGTEDQEYMSEIDLQGAFKESFLLDVGGGRAVKMTSLPTPSLEKADPLAWL